MPPLYVPVSTNPIEKTPVSFSDGTPLPSNAIQKGSYNNTVATSSRQAMAYDKNNDECHIAVLNHDPTVVHVYDGISNTEKRTYNLSAYVGTFNDYYEGGCFYNGYFYVIANNASNVSQFDPNSGAQIATYDISGFLTNYPGDIAFADNGDLLVYESQAGLVHRFDGFSNTLKNTIDVSSVIQFHNYYCGVTVANGNMVIIVYADNVSNNVLTLFVFDGITTTLLRTKSVDSLAGGRITNCDVKTDANGLDAVVYDVGNYFSPTTSDQLLIALVNAGNGQTYTGNSGKTLKTGDVYSFYFGSSNQVTNPTLNDGGQGAKTVVLPNGNGVPIGALTGALDFYYDGNNYVVQSLNDKLAVGSFTGLAQITDVSTDESTLGFNVWRNPSVARGDNRPTLVEATVRAQTDGSTNGSVRMDVDESGGTSADYYQRTVSHSASGAGVNQNGNFTLRIPPGGAYRIYNQADPNNANTILSIREWPE